MFIDKFKFTKSWSNVRRELTEEALLRALKFNRKEDKRVVKTALGFPWVTIVNTVGVRNASESKP